ncbi:MAG: ATP-binding protein [Desulfurococcales archaeon]|nr:ATP-binding protein [Desulfurococcales archaeon]
MEKSVKSSRLNEWVRDEEGLGPAVTGMLRRAYERASSYGRVIGRVSRYSEVKTEASTRIIFEVDPATYYTSPSETHRIGSYISIIDPKTSRVILARITGITRRDQLASIGVEPPLSSYSQEPDPQSLLTTTLVEAELLMEADLDAGEEPTPAVTPIEPQSPVVDPESWVIARLLDLPGEGVIVGSLSTPAGLVKRGAIPVRLPYRSLLQHTLILGTTGSGKTTLMKNMIASIASDPNGPLVIVVDMNQDFTQLPLPPDHQLENDEVYRAVYTGVRHPTSLIVVAAVTLDIIRLAAENLGRPSIDFTNLFLEIARIYYQDTYTPLTSSEHEGNMIYRERSNTILIDVSPEWGDLTFIPYTISTINTNTDKLAPLMPGMTTLARELLRRIRERYFKLHGAYGPLQALEAALLSYLEGSSRGERYDLDESLIVSSVTPYIVADEGEEVEDAVAFKIEGVGHSMVDAVDEYFNLIHAARPHRGTVEALYRRIASLLESDMVDIAIAWMRERRLRILPEPSWSSIVDEARDRNAPIVLDLGWSSSQGGIGVEGSRLAAYRMLDKLISWKHAEWAGRRRARNILVFIDEAHQFFPQESGSWDDVEVNRQLASMISRIARLGRARGLGLVFSTHSPRDLHDIILQLANTKIILRTEKQHAEKLDIPSEIKALISRLPDRTMYILSHIFKEGYIMAKTSKPITAHFDISAYAG